jgi:small subunit ribosomal protein S6
LEVSGLKTIAKKLYEAMFLVDSAEAASDWDGVETNMDEQRLAYEIDRHSRGTYILCYFRADGKRTAEIEKAVQLSEQIMRVLILCAEGREKEIEKDTPTMLAEKNEQEAIQATAEESERPEQSRADGSAEAMAADAASEQPEEGETGSEEVDEQEEKKSEGEEVSE